MNVLNRILVILLILATMILVPLVLIFPEYTASVVRYVADLIDLNLQWLNGLSESAQLGMRFLLAAIALLVFLIGILFLILEIVRLRRTTVRLRDGKGELMMDSVSQYIGYFVDAIPDVIHARPEIVSKGNKIRVSMYAETTPGVNVPAKTAEIEQTIRQVVEDQMGLELDRQVHIVIRPIAYPRGRGKPVVSPAPAVSQPEPVTEAKLESFAPPPETPAETQEQVVSFKRPPVEEEKRPEGSG